MRLASFACAALGFLALAASANEPDWGLTLCDTRNWTSLTVMDGLGSSGMEVVTFLHSMLLFGGDPGYWVHNTSACAIRNNRCSESEQERGAYILGELWYMSDQSGSEERQPANTRAAIMAQRWRRPSVMPCCWPGLPRDALVPGKPRPTPCCGARTQH